MRASAVLAFVFLSLVAGSAVADLVYKDGALYVRLHNAPCTVPGAADHLKPHTSATPQSATVEIRGKAFRACWAPDADGDYVIVDEAGGGGILFGRFFKETPGA